MDEGRSITRALMGHLAKAGCLLHLRQQVFELFLGIAGCLASVHLCNRSLGIQRDLLEMRHVVEHHIQRAFAFRQCALCRLTSTDSQRAFSSARAFPFTAARHFDFL